MLRYLGVDEWIVSVIKALAIIYTQYILSIYSFISSIYSFRLNSRLTLNVMFINFMNMNGIRVKGVSQFGQLM